MVYRFKEQWIHLPGNKFPLCYMERGSSTDCSKTVLFIHGFSCTKEFGLFVASHLPSTEYHVLAIDLPGHGKSLIGEQETLAVGIPYYVDVVKKVGTFLEFSCLFLN